MCEGVLGHNSLPMFMCGSFEWFCGGTDLKLWLSIGGLVQITSLALKGYVDYT